MREGTMGRARGRAKAIWKARHFPTTAPARRERPPPRTAWFQIPLPKHTQPSWIWGTVPSADPGSLAGPMSCLMPHSLTVYSSWGTRCLQ